MHINSCDDWWRVLEDNWDNILVLMSRFLGANNLPPVDLGSPKLTNLEAMIYAKKQRDETTLLHFLFGIWDEAPDNPGIHDYPSWDAICDLQSEAWVFQNEEAYETVDDGVVF